MRVRSILGVLMLTTAVTAIGKLVDSIQVDQGRINEILFSVLDTLHAKVDSSDLSDGFPSYPQHWRRKWILQVIEEGYSYPPASALFKGIDMATRDLLRGRFALKYRGEMIILVRLDSISWRTGPVYQYNLRSMFGIELESVKDGPAWKWYALFEKGYNLVAISVLNEYFGCDVRSKAHDAVRETILRVGQSFRDEWIEP
jgi:hypothetical protein